MGEKKPRFMSVHLLSDKNIDAKTPEGNQQQLHLKDVLQRWKRLSKKAHDRKRALQRALLQCQEFDDMMQNYLVWLERMEKQVNACDPDNLEDRVSLLQEKLKELKVSRSLELVDCRVVSGRVKCHMYTAKVSQVSAGYECSEEMVAISFSHLWRSLLDYFDHILRDKNDTQKKRKNTLCLCTPVSLCLSVCLSVGFCLSVHPSVCLSVFLSLSLWFLFRTRDFNISLSVLTHPLFFFYIFVLLIDLPVTGSCKS